MLIAMTLSDNNICDRISTFASCRPLIKATGELANNSDISDHPGKARSVNRSNETNETIKMASSTRLILSVIAFICSVDL